VRVLLRATPTATGTSVFKVILVSERPVILTFEYRALGEGAITNVTYFIVVVLTRPERTGLGLTTSRMVRGQYHYAKRNVKSLTYIIFSKIQAIARPNIKSTKGMKLTKYTTDLLVTSLQLTYCKNSSNTPKYVN
jgi:hypothetical protein